MPCRDQLAQLRRHESEFTDLHTTVATITFGPASRIEAWLRETQSPFVLLLDRRRTAYEAYAVRRSIRSVSMAAVVRSLELMRQGQPARGPQGDWLQLGGTFIVDHAGILRFAHRSTTPVDYPAVDELFAVLGGLTSPSD